MLRKLLAKAQRLYSKLLIVRVNTRKSRSEGADSQFKLQPAATASYPV